jgi:serine/threonine protein kinase
MQFSDFTLVKKLGEGGFGKVYLATCQNTNAMALYGIPNLVALKLIDLSSESTLETVKAHKEVQILSQLKHINIVRLYHSFYE